MSRWATELLARAMDQREKRGGVKTMSSLWNMSLSNSSNHIGSSDPVNNTRQTQDARSRGHEKLSLYYTENEVTALEGHNDKQPATSTDDEEDRISKSHPSTHHRKH